MEEIAEPFGDGQRHPLSLALQEGVSSHRCPHAYPLDMAGVERFVPGKRLSQLLRGENSLECKEEGAIASYGRLG